MGTATDGNHVAPALKKKIHAVYNGGTEPDSLGRLCTDLLREQRRTWEKLRNAYSDLQKVIMRDVACTGFKVRLQYNPNRITSIAAAVSENEVKARPCFLCLGNLPEEQRAVLWRSRYLVLLNPMPVFPLHLTLAHLEHRPQSITDHIDDLLAFSQDFGEGWLILYNGPACGASAPDHLHFQAIPAGRLPIEDEILQGDKEGPAGKDDALLYRAKNLGREVIVIEGRERERVAPALKHVMAGLKQQAAHTEPMVNIIGFRHEGFYRLLLFPRSRHRPEAFFCDDDRRVLVSPAVIEMGGVLVTAAARDLERLDARAVEALYREVSLFLPR